MSRITLRSWLLPLALLVALPAGLAAQQVDKPPAPDLAKEPTLYVVGYAHLDTEWRWDYPTTIREYLPKTIRDNFQLFEKYPHYVFSFSGANRYRMIKEYYPADYEKLKKYVAAGRWFPSGSSMEENDVNAPSAESTIRQILYGTQFFKREFGKTSAEYMLPDCFGFPASLPSILAHAGIKAFSTQKLSSSWQPAARVGGPDSIQKTPVGIPFNIGIWEGLDGKSVIAALNPGSYGGSVTYDLTKAPPPIPSLPAATPAAQRPRPLVDWPARIRLNGEASGLFADYMYYGTGDTGGSPNEASVSLMEAIVTRGTASLPDPYPVRPAAGQPAPPTTAPAAPVRVGDGPVRVMAATAEQLFRDMKPEHAARLPRYRGDLELINHSAGSITSQAYMKRWNRHNELLADAAERASVAAAWLGGRPYPRQRLNDAWTLVMGGQFHDIIPGTSIPKAYEYAWNDEVLALNQFAGVLSSATEAIAGTLDTRAIGLPIVVFNPLNITREDVVEASVAFPGGMPPAVQVVGPDGREIPAQITEKGTVLFLAKVPSVGYAVFDVRPAAASTAAPAKPARRSSKLPVAPVLAVSESILENGRYRVTLNDQGDVASLFDKTLQRELLSGAARLEIKTDNPAAWPAWNMDWEDQTRAPRAYVQGPARVRIVERGPVRVAVEITREAEGSTFVQTVRLAAGDAGNRVEFANAVDWRTKEAHLKAVFPLSAANEVATYNWDIGTIERPTNDERQFEVASHQWLDLTDASGAFGATLLSDSKIGSDKPNANTLRLTLVRTPGVRGGYTDQGSQDWGHHEFVYGLAGHAGTWKQAQTDWQGHRLNQPLIAFQSASHPGTRGKTFSLVSLSSSRVRVLALKKAEQGDEIVVRLVELDGKPAPNVRLAFPVPVLAAREVNGVEDAVGEGRLVNGSLVTELGPFQVRSFAVTLAPPSRVIEPPAYRPLELAFDRAVGSRDGSVSGGAFDTAGRSLPAEMLPKELPYDAVRFTLGPAAGLNAVVPRGQTLRLPEGHRRLYLLAAAANGDQKATFKVGDVATELTIQDWGGYIGQWDNRVWDVRQEPTPPRSGQPAPAPGAPVRMRTVSEFKSLTPGFIKRTPVAWFASHRHGSDGTNQPYEYAYLYAYVLDIPPGATTLTLPVNDRVRLLAATVSIEPCGVRPAQPLYDELGK